MKKLATLSLLLGLVGCDKSSVNKQCYTCTTTITSNRGATLSTKTQELCGSDQVNALYGTDGATTQTTGGVTVTVYAKSSCVAK